MLSTKEKTSQDGGKFALPLYLVIYFLATIVYLEIIFKVFVYGQLEITSLIAIALIAAIIANLIVLIVSLPPNKNVSHLLAMFFVVFICCFFIAQFIYIQFFRTPMLFYSIFHGESAVAQFSSEIWECMVENFPQILLMLAPILLFYLTKQIFIQKADKFGRVTLVSSAVIVFLIFLGFINSGEKSPGGAYALFYDVNVPALNQQYFGVLGNISIDATRTIFGFEPHDSFVDKDDKSIGAMADIYETAQANAFNINFAALAAKETNADIAAIDGYFASVQPTYQNDHTGVFSGCNLIFITAESFSQYLLDDKYANLFPTLRRLQQQGYTFSDFYNPLWNVSTTDGEYLTCTGLLPHFGTWSFSQSSNNYLPFCLAKQFTAAGYSQPMAFHNSSYTYYERNLSHANIGYKFIGEGNGLKFNEGWPPSDLQMMEQTVGDYINNAPFHAYYMTVSGHLPYNFPGNVQAAKHRDEVANLNVSDELKAYIACNIELEQAVSYLIGQLEAAGQLSNTVIVITADHYPYGLSDQAWQELAGNQGSDTFERYHSTLLVWRNGMKTETIDKPCSTLDILPTISNLFGLPYDSRLLMGQDIFSDSTPLVLFNDHSWITDQASYNSMTGEVKGDVSEDYVNRIHQKVNDKITYSARILDTDYYQHLSKQIKKGIAAANSSQSP